MTDSAARAPGPSAGRTRGGPRAGRAGDASVVAVAAVKPLDAAKTRIAVPGPAEDAARLRADLVLAMLRDTLAAVLAAAPVSAVYVASPDPAVLAAVVEAGGVPVPEPEAVGLNPALETAAAAARRDHPGAAVLAVQPDLPALRPAELEAFLARARGRRAFAPDLAGTGTVALLGPAGAALRPAFGVGSAAAHAAAATTVTGPWPGLHGDVDTVTDLADRWDRVGRHTRAAWESRAARHCGPDGRSV